MNLLRERLFCTILSLVGTVCLVAMSSAAPVAAKDAVHARTATVHFRTI